MGRFTIFISVYYFVMLRKKDRLKNKSKIFKPYEVIAERDGDPVSYWFSASSPQHAEELFLSFVETKGVEAIIIEIIGEE